MTQLFGIQIKTEKIEVFQILIHFVVVGWLIELLFKTITITIATCLIRQKNLTIKEITQHLKTHFNQLVLATAVYTIPLLIAFLTILNKAEKSGILLVIIGLIIVIISSLVLPFIPVILIIENLNWKNTIQQTHDLLKHNWRKIIALLCIIFVINTFSLLLSTLTNKIPIIGNGLLKIVIESIATTHIYVLTVFFYLGLKKKKKHQTKEISENNSLENL
ncbi:MAG: hypothetical protein VW378_01245 [bacterium]